MSAAKADSRQSSKSRAVKVELWADSSEESDSLIKDLVENGYEVRHILSGSLSPTLMFEDGRSWGGYRQIVQTFIRPLV